MSEITLHDLVQADDYERIKNYYQSTRCLLDSDGFTASMLAAHLNRMNCLRAIRGCELQDKSDIKEFRRQHAKSKETALIMAVKQRNEESAKVLISECGMIDQYGFTALAYALMGKHDSLVKLLAPAERLCNIQGLTVLQFTVFSGLPKYFSMFKDQLGQFSVPTANSFKFENTALMIASLSARTDFMMLLEEEAGLQDCDGVTALMRVIGVIYKLNQDQHKRESRIMDEPYVTKNVDDLIKAAELLIKYQKELGKQDKNGVSALMRASMCRLQCDSFYEVLVQAESELKDDNGRTYLDYQSGHLFENDLDKKKDEEGKLE
ncbi:Ankyrin_repeat-containing protein [Hexamita inflata]|uniref:Ankyrin repeat-containing protein n=1 Tax=Hexamita inflata TaxID=28002 RepID=A0AA86NH27_9EUKA|nr:Ankyrin repeat-containing protein [Hexamita inflata]CAI9919035.1 Ankyrin repeat-containing protein [Hexamita inflata]CAI9973978.1 Ankyrin repeat-containing protein [Hexamita inflata]